MRTIKGGKKLGREHISMNGYQRKNCSIKRKSDSCDITVFVLTIFFCEKFYRKNEEKKMDAMEKC